MAMSFRSKTSRLFKACAVGLAVFGALGVTAGTAQADALAVSVMLETNLLFSNATTGVTLDASAFSTVVFTDSAQVTASLGGLSATQTGGPSSPIDLYACAPGSVGCPANNTFPFTVPPPTTTFATADQLLTGAPITGLPGLTAGATADLGTYASLSTPNTATSTADNGLNSTFAFTLLGATAVKIDFDAQAYLDAFTAAGQIFPTNALSAYTKCFDVTLVSTGATVVHWCPNGVNAPGDASDIGLTASTEPFNLNQNASVNAPFNGNQTTGVQSGHFSATTVTLLANTPYRLNLVESSRASALEVAAVPAPASLIMLGAALLGFGGVVGLRRRKS